MEGVPASGSRAAAGIKSFLQQRARGERPLQLDARLRSKVAFGAYRSADRTLRVVAKRRRVEAREQEPGGKGERIAEEQLGRPAHFAARGRGAEAADLDQVAAAHGFGAERHASLCQRAAHALRFAAERELERSRKLGLTQRRAQPAQVQAARFHRAVETVRTQRTPALEQTAA